MKAIKVISIIVAVVMALAIILVGAGIFFTNRYLQTPAFKQQALQTARNELGVDVQIDDLKVSIFSGVLLRGVTIGNPPGFPGNMVTANTFVLRYRLLPLLHHRAEIEELSLDRPVITLSENDQAKWNYEMVGGSTNAATQKENTTGTQPATISASTNAPAPASAEKSGKAIPLDVVLSKIAITHGSLSMVSVSNKPVVKVDGINFSSAVNLIDNKLSGNGNAGIDKIDLSEKLFVENAGTMVKLEPDHVILQSLRGELADGTISGDVSVNYATGMLYAVSVALTNSDVAKLLQDAGSKPTVTGKLNITTSLTGSGGVPTIVGSGRVEVDNGQFKENPVLNSLGMVLQLDALRDLSFSQCLIEYSISNNLLNTSVIRLTSPQLQITGSGTVALDKNRLNHNMTITLPKGSLNSVLLPAIRELFTEQPDGSLTLDFKVTGTLNSPKTDLTKRLGQQLLKNGLQQFFNK